MFNLIRIYFYDGVKSSGSSSTGTNTGNTTASGGSTSSKFKDKISNLTVTKSNVYTFNSDMEYGVFENYDDAVTTLPSSLFYEAQSSEDGRSGLFNYYLIGDTKKGRDGKKFTYIKSETFAGNQAVSPDYTRNPTAQSIIQKTTFSGAYLEPSSKFVSQPYNVKDFIFCKNYGVIPNNRMITLRRFPTPVMDNLRVPLGGNRIEATDNGGKISATQTPIDGITKDQMIKSGVALPLAQAITFFGEGTGNDLSDIIGIDSGLNWADKQQSKMLKAEGNDPGLTNTNLYKYIEQLIGPSIGENLKGLSTLLGGFTDPDNIDMQIRRSLFDQLHAPGGPLSERIFVDVNTVDKMSIRQQGFTGGDREFSLKFSYNLASVGQINSRMMFIDLLTNILAIGTDYGTFLAPQLLVNPNKKGIGFPGGAAEYIKSMLDPVGFINDMVKINFSAEMQAKLKTLKGDLAKAKAELTGLGNGVPLSKDSQIYKTIGTMMTSALLTNLYFEPMMLSGYPTGEWHIVVGNPLNPIAMIGNLICKGVNVKFNNVLGADDFPTEMEVTYKLKPARQRHRGDFESLMNRGSGRLYLGKMQIADQSKNAYVGAISGNDYNNMTISSTKDVAGLASTATTTIAGLGSNLQPIK